MSLVAYDSSDEGSEDEGSETVENTTSETATENSIAHTNTRLCLPAPKHNADISRVETSDKISEEIDRDESGEKINFNKLPRPKCTSSESMNVLEEDDIPPKKNVDTQMEKSVKKERGPVKITVPSLSEFKDIEEEDVKKRDRVMPSKKGTGLFALLPPPKSGETKGQSTLIPHVLQKNVNKKGDTQGQPLKVQAQQTNIIKTTKVTASASLGLANYDSNSEDEDDAAGNNSTHPSVDFFALTTTETVPTIHIPDSVNSDILLKSSSKSLQKNIENNPYVESTTHDYTAGSSEVETDEGCTSKTLVSNVMNLPKEEILLKNKAEVGPKLPVPEQEYNIDTEGNVAFDEKAIEYLCGKRGIKRKNKEIDEANIIEINGEDIKPDEREWLVKALTEEPVARPVSMQSGGVNSQSKKKHQITYLAHQAKAMEMELKNQWALNRMTRKQTQSKYGF